MPLSHRPTRSHACPPRLFPALTDSLCLSALLAVGAHRWLSIAALVLASLAAPKVSALGLAQAYEAALSNDPQFRAAQAQALVGAEALPQAVARLRPSVNLATQNFRIHQDRTDGENRFPTQNYPSYNISLSARQPVYSPRLWRARDQAQAATESAQAVLDFEQQALASRVISAYANLALAYEQQALIQVQQESASTRLQAATRALQAGTGIRTDIDEIRAQLDLLQAQMLQARQSIQASQAELEQMTGKTISQPIRLKPSVNPETLDPGMLQTWLDKATRQNPELLARQAQARAALAASRVSQADHLPTLDLVVQVSKNSSENSFFVNSKTETQAVGLQVNLPLYQGGFLQSRDRQTAAESVSAEEQAQRALMSARIEVSKAFYALKEGVARVRALENAVASAEQVVLANQKSFAAGLRSMLDILAAEQRAAQTRLDLAQARLQLVANQVRLEGLVGETSAQGFAVLAAWFQ